MPTETVLKTRIVKEALSRLRESKWKTHAIRAVAMGLGHKTNKRVTDAFRAAENLIESRVALAIEGAIGAYAEEIGEGQQRAMDAVESVQKEDYDGPEQKDLRAQLQKIANDLRQNPEMTPSEQVKLVQALLRAETLTHTDVHEVSIVDFADRYPKETTEKIEADMTRIANVARDAIITGKVDLARLMDE